MMTRINYSSTQRRASACGGSSQLGANPVQQNLVLIDRGAVACAALGRSWMAPEAKKSDLRRADSYWM
jgi:hypothetical protein